MDTDNRNSGESSSFGSMISSVTHEVTALIRDEVELAKAEMREKVSQVTTSVTSMAVAGGVLLCGFLVLLAAAGGPPPPPDRRSGRGRHRLHHAAERQEEAEGRQSIARSNHGQSQEG